MVGEEIFPFIEGDGTIFSEKIDTRAGRPSHVILLPRKGIKWNPETPIVAPIYNVFKAYPLGFALNDEQRCIVYVYVDEKFPSSMKYLEKASFNEEEREEFIQNYLVRRQAWFFTYGERIKCN